jgi:hypothetical protein
MAVSKKAVFFVVLLVGAVSVAMKFLLDPFGSKQVQSPQSKELVVEEKATPTPKETEKVPPQTPTTAESTKEAALVPSAVQAKNLSVETSYTSPAGPEKVGFTLEVDTNGMVTKAETVVGASDDKSVSFQKNFQTNLSGAVVGKKLSDLTRIDKVGKASLTTGAFNAALSQLKAQL